MMQEAGRADDQLETLTKMIAAAKAAPDKLLWLKGEPLSEPADVFVPEKLHSYGIYYVRKENEDDDERFAKIAHLAAKHYPEHPYAYNDIALYHSVKKNQPETRKYLELALQKNPKDTLVLMNLAETCLKMKDNAKARECYRFVIRLNSNPEHTAGATKALRKLDPQTKS